MEGRWKVAEANITIPDHIPELKHHFDDSAQQLESSTLGMWVFLLTEIMFFGGMFGSLHHLPQHVSGSVRLHQPLHECRRSADQHRRSHLSSLTHGAGGARGAVWARRRR